MTTPQPRPTRPAQTTAIQAKPVAPPPTTPQKKQVDIETLAYELREIRILMENSLQRTHSSAWTYMIFGVLMACAGVVTHSLGGAALVAAGAAMFVLGVGLQTK